MDETFSQYTYKHWFYIIAQMTISKDLTLTTCQCGNVMIMGEYRLMFWFFQVFFQYNNKNI